MHIYNPIRKCRIMHSQPIFSNNFTSTCRLILISAVFVTTINFIQVDAIECGTVNVYRETVLGGKEVVKYEWPFIAALYKSRTSQYFCGGTIISHKHVLTAAHCIQTKGQGVPLTPEEITVRLGAYNLTDQSEKDAVNRNVTQIYIHPDWNSNEEKYNADIAILVLNGNLTFSNHIRPVCMPSSDFFIDGLIGTVVGWGKTENGTAEGIPRKIEINALNDTYCYETDEGIARFASERSFCGEGSGTPNEGDSGGGFFAVAGSGWVQFGTVTFIRPQGTRNNLKFALYMKLTSLIDWVAEKVEQSGGNISFATMKTDLNCTYRYSRNRIYGCFLFDLNIRQQHFEVKEFNGLHNFDKDNDDVELIAFETGILASPPRNFGNIFRNLKTLIMSVNTRRIFRSNFQNLERLEMIICHGSIGQLDENSFWDLSNLQFIAMDNCELKSLHAGTFSRNYKLTEVRVSSSALKSLPRNLFRNNLLLESVTFDNNSIETIDENIFETNVRLNLVSLKGNRLGHLSKNLFRNNSELEVLDLSNNRIKTIDEGSLKANFKLLLLSLESNELAFLPEQLLQGMEFLERIYLQKNSLQTIDAHFFETNVRINEIDLQLNGLRHIPANLFRNNSRLQFVDLAANSIEVIDAHLFERNLLLQNISLILNRLVELPKDLFRHNSMLIIVDVFFNALESIDEHTFEWNTELRKIDFGGNYVTMSPGKLFKNNLLLEIVSFSTNYLDSIDEHTFQTNANLQAVYLQSNMLHYLPETLFHNNRLLQIVDLSSNFFTTLNDHIFTNNVNLEKIILQHAQMRLLPRNLFQNNSRLEYIDLRGSLLQVIETNFIVLKHVNCINVSKNRCTDTVFYGGEADTYMFSNETRWTGNLTEFQDIVTANCS